MPFRLSTHDRIRNKNESANNLGTGWRRQEDWSADDLLAHITAGKAFSCGLFSGTDRNKAALVGFQLVALDFDGEAELVETLLNPFVDRHCLLSYTSFSHGKEGLDRFRLVFALPAPLTHYGPEVLQHAMRGLWKKLCAEIGIELQDASSGNAAGVWYGNTNTVAEAYPDAKPLPAEWADLAIDWAVKEIEAEKTYDDAKEDLDPDTARRAIYVFDHLLPEPGPGTRATLFIPAIAAVGSVYKPGVPHCEELLAACCRWAARSAYRRNYPQTVKTHRGEIEKIVDTTSSEWILKKAREFTKYRIGSLFEVVKKLVGADWQQQLPGQLRKAAAVAPAGGARASFVGRDVVPPAPRSEWGSRPAPGAPAAPPAPPAPAAPVARLVLGEGDDAPPQAAAAAVPPAPRKKSKKATIIESQAEIEAGILRQYPGLGYNRMTHGIEYRVGPNSFRTVPISSATAALNRLSDPSVYPRERVEQTIRLLAQERSFNPVADWLQALPHAGTTILDELGTRVFGPAPAEEPSVYCSRLKRERPLRDIALERWLASAVARAFVPACPVDICLLLLGPQAVGKTAFFRALLPPWAQQASDGRKPWITVPPPRPLDGLRPEMVFSSWLILLDEIDGILGNPQHAARIKAIITSPVDTADIKYMPESVSLERSSVFCATTNRRDALNDSSGNRRFMVLEVSGAVPHPSGTHDMVDLDYVAENHAAIWAAARDVYESFKARQGWLHGQWVTRAVVDYLGGFNPSSGLESVVESFVKFGYGHLLRVASTQAMDGAGYITRDYYIPFLTVDDFCDFTNVPVAQRTRALTSRVNDAFVAFGLEAIATPQQTFGLNGDTSIKAKGYVLPGYDPQDFSAFEAIAADRERRGIGASSRSRGLDRRV